MRGPWLLATIAVVLLPGQALRADEAIFPNGMRRPGTLRLAQDRLLFAPQDGSSVPATELHAVRFPPASLPPLRAPISHRIVLYDGQQITGQLLGLNDQRVRLRTVWADEVSMPRTTVAAVTQLPVQTTFLLGEFNDGLPGWKVIGTPALGSVRSPSGQRSLILSAPGQVAEHVLVKPLEAGVVGVNFLDSDKAAGARWMVEAELQEKGEPRVVRVILAGAAEAYSAEVPLTKGTSARVARSPGWHRLRLELQPSGLVVTVDDAVLWYSREQGLEAPLRAVRLLCAAEPQTKTAHGEVAFSDFSLARSIEDLPRPPGDPSQDEVWLLSGDQVFGQVLQADGKQIALRGRFGERTLPWGEVRGLFLQRGSPPLQTTEGEHVRTRLRCGVGADLDELHGVVAGLDERQLVLRHPVLGECKIERGRLQQLQSVFAGRRIELDNGVHHLGPAGGIHENIYPLRAEGPRLKWTCSLAAVPASARLTVQISELAGAADGIAQQLERGELRTEVLVNGQRVDYLNRQMERASPRPRRLTVEVPARFFRSGENTIELVQTEERETSRVPHCGVSGVVLELPR